MKLMPFSYKLCLIFLTLLWGVVAKAGTNYLYSNEETDSAFRQAGNFIFISSQIPLNNDQEPAVPQALEEQVKLTLANLQKQVFAAGATMAEVVKITVYMEDIDQTFPLVKKHIPEYFSVPYPARSPIGGVSFGTAPFKIAIDAIVYKKDI